MKDTEIHAAIRILRRATRAWTTPYVTQLARGHKDPFHILISTMLSLRTKDAVTAQASNRLFALADTPAAMVRLSPRAIEKAIYPVGFYRVKARNILSVCRELLERPGSRVPDDIDALVALPGVGRKTANLVVTLGFGKPGICVDTHVHRITNRWGYVRTRKPEQTEMALRAKLPRAYWIEINDELVAFGQNLCHPTSPRCSVCPLIKYCDRVGVCHRR
ncbi:MAG: endonuclease III, partial [Chloroflexota bacterium]|nr:endonuclease III [Chloroflexota bacterium]